MRRKLILNSAGNSDEAFDPGAAAERKAYWRLSASSIPTLGIASCADAPARQNAEAVKKKSLISNCVLSNQEYRYE